MRIVLHGGDAGLFFGVADFDEDDAGDEADEPHNHQEFENCERWERDYSAPEGKGARI